MYKRQVQGSGELLGRMLPLKDDSRYCGLLPVTIPLDPDDTPYEAPFPDRGHRAALRAFPVMVSDFENSEIHKRNPVPFSSDNS